MAMKIGTKYEYQTVLQRHWEKLCQEIGYSYPALRELIKKQGEMILTALESKQGTFFEMMPNKPKNVDTGCFIFLCYPPSTPPKKPLAESLPFQSASSAFSQLSVFQVAYVSG